MRISEKSRYLLLYLYFYILFTLNILYENIMIWLFSNIHLFYNQYLYLKHVILLNKFLYL